MRSLPMATATRDFPMRKMVYNMFRRWRQRGVWHASHDKRFSAKRLSLLGTLLPFGAIVALALFLAVGGTAQAQSIAVKWAGYYNDDFPIPAATPEGIQLPDGSYNANWTNIQAAWYGLASANNTGLQNNLGQATTAAVTQTATGSGTYWFQYGTGSGDTLLSGGAMGGDGPIANVITGIPYASYEIIGYTNPYGDGNDTVWLDSDPASSNAANAPRPNSQYWFSSDNGNGLGLGADGDFDVMTNNTNPASFPSQNTVVWTGLTGTAQTLWASDNNGNDGFIGFEIVSTGSPNVDWNGNTSGDVSKAINYSGASLAPTSVLRFFNQPLASTAFAPPSSNSTAGFTVGGLIFDSVVNPGATVNLTSTNSIKIGASGIAVNSGAYQYAVTLNLPITLGAGQTWTNNSTSPLTISGAITAAGNNLIVNGSGNVTLSGGITDVSPASLTYSGNGLLTLGTANSFNGPTTISSGTVRINNSNALQNSVVTPSSSTDLSFNLGIGQVALGGLSGSPSLTLQDSGGASVALTLGNSLGNNASYSGNLTSSSTLTKVGTNTQTLTGNNSFSTIAVNAGTLSIGPAASGVAPLGTAPVTLSGTATLQLLGQIGSSAAIYNNNLSVVGGADSTIDVSPAVSLSVVSMGNLQVDNGSGTTLNVTAASALTGQPYGLTLGNVLLLGNANINVANNTVGGGNALGTLTLGQLNDNGTKRTITFGGAGAVTLNSSATSLVPGTVVDINNVTLNSNNATALGNAATVNLGTNGALAVGANQSISALNSSASGAGQVNISPGKSLTVGSTDNLSSNFSGSINGGGSLIKAASGTLTLTGANTYKGSTTINAGTLQIGATGSIASTSVSVAAGGTLLLAGSTGGLPSAVNITTHGTGSAGDGAFTVSGTAAQTVGVVSGDRSVNGAGATVYAGNTTVGNGTNVANLSATQILQNTLTINAGSTVTILPSGPGIPVVAASDSSVNEFNATDSSDPFLAIQAAILSGAISSLTGQRLENRLAAIGNLETTDPGLDVRLLESRVLAAIPSSSAWPSTGSVPVTETGSGLLTVDSSKFASGSRGASVAFAPGASFDGGPAAVPEPSTLLLAAFGGIGIALASRRRILGRNRDANGFKILYWLKDVTTPHFLDA
jgi:fibronectin-binding autotransporter adhesin